MSTKTAFSTKTVLESFDAHLYYYRPIMKTKNKVTRGATKVIHKIVHKTPAIKLHSKKHMLPLLTLSTFQ